LESFLNEIKHPKEGITISEFRNVVELQEQFISSLAHLLTRKFKETFRPKKSQPIELEQIENSRIYSDTNLGTGLISEFSIPNTSSRGEKHTVSAKFEGSTKSGFLDLMIKDSKGKNLWFPDHIGWDPVNDEGKIILNNDSYSNSWDFIIPQSLSVGNSIAFMGFYEDTLSLPTRNRRLISYQIKNITII